MAITMRGMHGVRKDFGTHVMKRIKIRGIWGWDVQGNLWSQQKWFSDAPAMEGVGKGEHRDGKERVEEEGDEEIKDQDKETELEDRSIDRENLQSAVQEKLSASNSALRKSIITGNWVVFAKGRSHRPKQTKHGGKRQKVSQQDVFVADCPFCAGNEHRTPTSLLEYPSPDGKSWSLRVVPNAFPAVGQHDQSMEMFEELRRKGHSVHVEVPATGHHEVVIECPDHNACTALAPKENLVQVLRAWHSRGMSLRDQDPTMQHLMYFKNNGSVAGASLLHPHSQIVGLPVVPRDVQNQQYINLRYFEENGESAYFRTLEEELAIKARGGAHRIVEETPDFVAYVPFAAPSPFNIWIMPRFDGAHFEEVPERQLEACGEVLWNSLRRLHFALDEPDWNLVLHSAPLHGRFRQQAFDANIFFRWHVVVTPRLGAGAMAGFELGSGIFSNGNMPEDDAALLRATRIY